LQRLVREEGEVKVSIGENQIASAESDFAGFEIDEAAIPIIDR
jgi:hypothetical protein